MIKLTGTIKIKCNCGKIHEVRRSKEIGPETKSLSCNWCPDCDETATEEYIEIHHETDNFNEPDPNQLKLL